MSFKENILGIFGKISHMQKILLLVIIVLVVGIWLGRLGRPVDSVTDQTKVSVQAKPQLWTCSMHPEIKFPKPGLCPKCNMELIPLVDDSDFGGGLRELVVSEAAMALMDVEVAPVERKFVDATVRVTGKVDYDETNLAYITAWVPGRLDKLYVDYMGVPVNKGDHMVYLYSPELIGAQEELLQAIEAVKNMKDTELNVMQEMTAGTVDAAREKLRLWGLKAEQIAEVEKTGTVTDHMTVYSPTSGIVIEKNAREGMYVQTGTKIYTIADLSKVWVILDAYESDLEWLRYGQEVEFTTVSSPGMLFKGTISFISPMLNEKTRTVKVRVNVSNETGKLKPGMFVKALVRSKISGGGQVMDVSLAGKWICPMHPEIIKDSADTCDICQMDLVRTEELGYLGGESSLVKEPLVIPVTAALITGSRAVVYVRLPNTEKPTFEGREIVLGPRAGDYYLVRSGLTEGELVVVRGNFKIDSSLQIMAKPSMMTPGEADTDVDRVKISDSFREQLGRVFAGYFAMQKALAGDDYEAAVKNAKPMLDSLKAVDMKLLTGKDHDVWMKNASKLKEAIMKSTEAKDIVTQRESFHLMSQPMVEIAVYFGSVVDGPVYIDHCSMAFDNTGADWLQDDRTLKNPYYGASMLSCGSIEEVVGVKGIWEGMVTGDK